jgi:ribosomal protein S12 methylthiotransferase accessory factor
VTVESSDIRAAAYHLRVVDDSTGFVETTAGVRRLRGTGLTGLAGRTEAEVAGLLGLPGPEPEPPQRPPLTVLGDDPVAAAVAAVFGPGTRLSGDYRTDRLDPAGPVVITTTSLFDPRPAEAGAHCAARGTPALFCGVLRDGVSFAGPFWRPGTACYECLRLRVCSNSVHGATWLDYLGHLSRTGKTPLPQRIGPAQAARVAAAVAALIGDGGPSVPEVIWWNGEDGEPVRRPLLPVPDCPACPAAGPAAPAAGADLEIALDDRLGIVHTVTVEQSVMGPPIHLGGGTSADFALLRPAMRVTRNGGAGFSAGQARAATIAETLERYAAGFYRPADLRLAARRELDATAVAPDRFGLFDTTQYAQPTFPFEPFTDDTTVRWVTGHRLGDGEPALLPASQVYMHYRRARGEAAIGPSVSTGLAAATDPDEAVLGGLYEVVERDALSISWLRRLPPRRLSPEVLDGSPVVSRAIAAARDWRVTFYDLSLDLLPPVIAAVMEHTGPRGRTLAFGSACRWSAVRAMEKAFLEAAQGLPYVRRLSDRDQDWEHADDFADVDDFNRHAVLYTRFPGLRERAGYLVHPTTPAPATRPARPPLPDLPPHRVLAELRADLATAGLTAYRVDLTTPDVRRTGLHVVRVVVPGMQHLEGSHRLRCLGNPRLRRWPAGDGPDINPYPHPLP